MFRREHRSWIRHEKGKLKAGSIVVSEYFVMDLSRFHRTQYLFPNLLKEGLPSALVDFDSGLLWTRFIGEVVIILRFCSFRGHWKFQSWLSAKVASAFSGFIVRQLKLSSFGCQLSWRHHTFILSLTGLCKWFRLDWWSIAWNKALILVDLCRVFKSCSGA